MKKKKALIISGIVVVLLVAVGWAALRFGVSFVFDKYVLETALSSITGNDTEFFIQNEENSAEKELEIFAGKEEKENPKQSLSGGKKTELPKQSLPGGEKKENSKKSLSGGEKTDNGGKATSSQTGTKGKLTNREIINKVMGSASLTNKMASMVSYEDKKRIISIVLSNFTKAELAEIAKNVKGGVGSDYKSKMISQAKSRLTGGQWQECLNIAYKYVDQIRPYVE